MIIDSSLNEDIFYDGKNITLSLEILNNESFTVGLTEEEFDESLLGIKYKNQ